MKKNYLIAASVGFINGLLLAGFILFVHKTTPELLIPVCSIIGVLMGIIGTLLFQFYTERAKYKEIIFKEKIDMYKEIFSSLGELQTKMISSKKPDDFTQIHKLNLFIVDLVIKYYSIIPEVMADNILKYADKISSAENEPSEMKKIVKDKLFAIIVDFAREDIGIEILSKETKDNINKMFRIS